LQFEKQASFILSKDGYAWHNLLIYTQTRTTFMTSATPTSTNNFIATPKIVPSGRATEIRILPTSPVKGFDPSAEYRVILYPTEEIGTPISNWRGPIVPAQAQDGALAFTATFTGEQRYVLGIEKIQGESVEVVDELAIYALQSDLYERYPYKGDMHMHSNRSDGVDAPAHVVAMCRKIGLDFMALTDHRQYAPSLEAQKAFQGVPVDLGIYSGEEVHPPENPIHIVNFGGRFSINDLFKSDGYQQEVQALQARLGNPPRATNPYWYASALWCFDKIHQAGGLGIFCHPYWFYSHTIHIPESLTSTLLETQPYDALELIGGYFRYEAWSNNWQVARYYQEVSNGKRIPIVGVSDAHGCHRDLFGWYYTIVFSPSPAFEDLTGSIKECYSVAVEAITGEVRRVHGPFRLVKYAHFLLTEVFPAHDALCDEEGDWMLAYLSGDLPAVENLHQAKGRTARWLKDRIWGS